MSRYFERALFVIGNQDSGKSNQLRSLFLDWRLGREGVIPDGGIPATYPLSNNRWLYLRLTSPQEWDEDMETFLNKCDKKMCDHVNWPTRWNFACPLQISSSKRMEGATKVISAFSDRFSPERIRSVILSPEYRGKHLTHSMLNQLHSELRAIPRSEVMMIDATDRESTGLILADYFDFT